jgi:hypothetical protein
MTSKLTLALNGAVVRKAKHYARQRNLSLSRLVESFFSSLTAETKSKSTSLPPITASLVGMIKAGNIREKDVLQDALIKKYL